MVLPQQPPRQPAGAITGDVRQPLVEPQIPVVKKPQEINPKIVEARALGLKGVPGSRKKADAGVLNLLPDQNYGPVAAAKRELALREGLEDYRRLTSKSGRSRPSGDSLTAPETPGIVTGEVSLPTLSAKYYSDQATKLLNNELDRRSSRDISKYEATEALLLRASEEGLSFTQKDLENVIDWGVLNSAANKAVALYQDKNVIGLRNVYLTLEETNFVMAGLLPEIIEEKLIESIEDPSIVENIVAGILATLTPILKPFVLANDWVMEGTRAGRVTQNPLSFLSAEARQAVQEGNYDSDYIQSIRESGNYSDLQISIALEVSRRYAMDHPDPIFSLYTEQYLGDEEAAEIFQDIFVGPPNSSTQELMRQIDSASLGNTGQVVLASSGLGLGSEYRKERGTRAYQDLANVGGFATTLVLDPTLGAFGVARVAQASRWTLMRLAPGGESAEKVITKMKLGKLEINTRTSRFFDQFANDLNEFDRLKKVLASAPASEKATARANVDGLRQRMSRQYKSYLPDDVIDDFIKYAKDPETGKYTIQSAAKYIDESNTAYITARGQIADEIAAMGATVDEIPGLVQQALNKADIKPLYARIAGQNQKRVALTPGMTLVGALRKNAVNGIIAGLMPEDRAIKILSKYIDSFDDAGEFSQQLSSKALEVGKETRKTKFFTGEGWFDSIGRMFSSIAISRSVSVSTTSDATTIYRWARQFFPKRTSEMLAQAWREGTTGSRRLQLSGMVRAGAASRGIVLTREQADTWVRQLTDGAKTLATGTRPGEQYGVSVPSNLLPSERVAQAAEIAARKSAVRKEMQAANASKDDIKRAIDDIDLEYSTEALEDAGELTYRSLSADTDGIESALHLYQTTDNVALPSLRDFEQLRGDLNYGIIPWGKPREGLSTTAQKATDYWSIGTLFGFRFSIRNAIEEVGLYWLMGGPRAVFDFFKGRQLDQASRSVKPRVYVKMQKRDDGIRAPKLDRDGVPRVVFKSDLGLFANKVEWLRRRATQSWRDKSKPTPFQKKVQEALDEWEKHSGFRHWMAEMILPATRYDDSLLALQEFAAGNPQAFAALATKAMMTRKSRGVFAATTISKDDEIAFNYAVNSVHGMALIDEIAEASKYLNSGGFPAFIRASGGITDELAGIPGIGFAKLGDRGALAGRFGDYTNVAPVQKNLANNEDIWGVSFWWRDLQHILDGDGAMGVAALSGIRGLMSGQVSAAQAKARIAEVIRKDKTFGYRERFSGLSSDSAVDDFADRYFENALQHFTRSDGSINKKLVDQFFDKDGTYLGWWEGIGSGDITPRISMADLKSFSTQDRPAFVFGRSIDRTPYVPFADTLPSLLDPRRSWTWMGAQNARISRAPIFWGNYTNQFGQTLIGRNGLASAIAKSRGRNVTAIDRKIADDEFARWSLDNAYNLTLSYIDNPSNRSNLAWKARNVSRYYRAQEDFYRRLVRVAKNNPEAYWRAALVYQNLDDMSFIYADDEGTKYFAYPGNELLQDAVSVIAGKYLGIDVGGFSEIEPFTIGGKVLGVAPSTDPLQLPPSFMGPMIGAPAAAIFHAFPEMAGLRSIVLGSYSQQSDSLLSDVVNAIAPAGLIRALRAADPEQVESSIAQSTFDAMAIAASQGLLDKLTITTEDGTQEINGVEVTPEIFKSTDQYKMLQALAFGNFWTKQGLSWIVAAAPQSYRNDISDFARSTGLVDARAGARRFRDIFFDEKYLELLEKHADGPNPFAVANAEWYKFKVETASKDGFFNIDTFMPFTLSNFKWNPEKPNLEFSSLAITQEWANWEKSDKSKNLTKNGFDDVKRFLAPRDGEFTWSAWNLATVALKLKIPKTEEEKIEEMFSVSGQARDNRIRNSYEKLIEQTENPELKKQYQESMERDRAENRLADPAWDIARTRFNAAERGLQARNAVARVTKMLDFIEKSEGSLDDVEESIRSSINVFLYYERQKRGIQGSRVQVSERRKELDAMMQNDFTQIKNLNQQVKIFIEGVLETAVYQDQFFSRREMQ